MTAPARDAHRIWQLLPAILVAVVFSWVFFLPVSHDEILYPLLGLLGLLAGAALIRNNPVIDVHIWLIAFLVAALGAYGNILGIHNPDPVFTVAVFLVVPALYLTCAATATLSTLRAVTIAAIIGTLAVSVVLLVYIAGAAGAIHQIVPTWVSDNLDMKATFRGGGSQARSWGLSSLAALGPIWMASLLVRSHPLLPPWWLRLVCAALSLATAVLSARDAITLVMILAPFIALFLRVTIFRTASTPVWLPRRLWQWVALGVAALIAAAVVVPRLLTAGPISNVLTAMGSFFGIRSASGDANQAIRSDEAWFLLQGWANNPIFGTGFRAAVPGYLRAEDIPWSLELQYHLLLFNVGLLGLGVAILILVIGFLFVRKAVVAEPTFMPILLVATTGAVTMLIANATNPYLVAPGQQWSIYLPLAVAAVAVRTATEKTGAAAGVPGVTRGTIVR